jgi:menaquinone-dependent protoporphyrinogen oxidase
VTVLVTCASLHGSTREMVEVIAEVLRARGMEVEASPVESAPDPGGYEAVVLGSAVYRGSWMREAAEFARRHRDVLAARPVWLFSSGPLGTEVEDAEEQPKELAELREAIGPRDHRVFFGALFKDRLDFGERMMIKAVRAPEGDFRDWDAIRAWAESIATELS